MGHGVCCFSLEIPLNVKSGAPQVRTFLVWGSYGNQLVLLCSFETGKSGIKKAGAQDAIGNMMPIRPATNDALSQQVSTCFRCR